MDSSVKQWAKEVLGGGFRAICFWAAICLNLAGLLSQWLPASLQLPGYVAWCLKWITPPVIVIGFVLSNIAAYSKAIREQRRLAGELDGIIVDLERTEAGEHLSPKATSLGGPAHHHVNIVLTLVARNRNAQDAGTVELITSTSNLRDGGPDCLWFEMQQLGNYIDRDGKRRRVENGDVRELEVHILYRFPISENYIEANRVVGELKLRDHRKNDLEPIKFSADILKNPIST